MSVAVPRRLAIEAGWAAFVTWNDYYYYKSYTMTCRIQPNRMIISRIAVYDIKLSSSTMNAYG